MANKPRDPAAHLRSQGALRQRAIRNKRKAVKSDRSKSKVNLRKETKDD